MPGGGDAAAGADTPDAGSLTEEGERDREG